MDQEHDGEIDRRHRRIEHRQQHRPGDECAQVLQIRQRLEFAARAALRGFGGGAENRSAQSGFGLDRDPHQDEAAHHVHQHMRGDRDDHDDRQHDQRIGAAAGQHAIGHVEQIDRNRQHQQVDGDREDPHGDQVAARVRKAFAEHITEFVVAGTLLQRRRATAASASTTPAAGGAATVLVASTMVKRRAPAPSVRSQRWIPAAVFASVAHRLARPTAVPRSWLLQRRCASRPSNADARIARPRAEGGSNHGRSGTILAVLRRTLRQADLAGEFPALPKRSLPPDDICKLRYLQ